MTPLGLGNDLGGSLRVPAQMCGIAALRPTRGRVANGAVTQPWPEPIVIQMTNCQGPMARRVADLRLALGIISAHDPSDPRWVPAPLQGPPIEGPVRVAVVRDPLGGGIDPHVRSGIDRAADWLANAGYEVVDAEPPQIAEAAAVWFEAIWADVGAIWPEMEPVAGREQVEFLKSSLAQKVFKPVDQAAQHEAWKAVHRLGSAWAQFAHDHPIVLSPVCCERPWLIDEDVSGITKIAHAMRMVVPVTFSDCLRARCPSAATTACPRVCN
jgi:amidase